MISGSTQRKNEVDRMVGVLEESMFSTMEKRIGGRKM